MATGHFGGVKSNQTVVAQARGDGRYRVYNNGVGLPYGVRDGSWDHVLNEFSYENGAWTGTSLGGVPDPRPDSAPGFESFLVADARGDGKSRIYAPNNVCLQAVCTPWTEFDHRNGAWSGQVIDFSDSFSSVGTGAAGDIRRDGFASFYFESFHFQIFDPSGPDQSRLYELRLQAGSWTRIELDRIPVGAEGRLIPPFGVVVGTARQDGVERLYLLSTAQAAFGPLEADVTEYTSAGGPRWERRVIAHLTLPFGATWHFFGLLPAHQGRPALYLVNYDGDFHELLFDGGQWKHTVASRLLNPGNLRQCAGGDGRNDGVYRLYCISGSAILEELTLHGDTWRRTDEIMAAAPNGFRLASVALGPGRNDGYQRIYVQRPEHEAFGVVGELVELTYRR